MKRILLVEDDPLVAIMLEGYLDALGFKPVASCETVAAALDRIAEGPIDAAIVDVHLANGEISGPVVDALRAAKISFLVMTGGHNIVTDPSFEGAPLLEKPFTLASLEAALARLGETG